jgi:hypothetical protein
MSARSGLDRETFQTVLASAFAVQESGMNKQSLSGIIEIHKAIAKDELPFDKLLDLIAGRARVVAGATGIAIGLLSGDQLVYRAGSGSGARYIGQHVTAVLSASTRTGQRKEILCVENAENDARIEAAICREWDAKALLIVPVYNTHSMAGVFEVLYRDPHRFDDGEMRTYRIMANLVQEAMTFQHSQKAKLTTRSTNTQPTVEKPPSRVQGPRSDGNPIPGPSVAPVRNATERIPSATRRQGSRPTQASSTRWPRKRAFFRNPRWTFDVPVLAVILGLAGWISLHQPVASTMERVPPTGTNPSGEHVLKGSINNLSNAPKGTHQNNAARPRFMRVQVGPNEVDYIAEDVTIRQFKKPVPLSHPPSVNDGFDSGDDVTEHTYKSTAEVSPESSRVKSDAIHSAPRH